MESTKISPSNLQSRKINIEGNSPVQMTFNIQKTNKHSINQFSEGLLCAGDEKQSRTVYDKEDK